MPSCVVGESKKPKNDVANACMVIVRTMLSGGLWCTSLWSGPTRACRKEVDRYHSQANHTETHQLQTCHTTGTLCTTGTPWLTGILCTTGALWRTVTLWMTGTIESWLVHLNSCGRTYSGSGSYFCGQSYSCSQSHSSGLFYSRSWSHSWGLPGDHSKSSSSPFSGSPISSSPSSHRGHPACIVWWCIASFECSQPTGKMGGTMLANLAPPRNLCRQLSQILQPWWEYNMDSGLPLLTLHYSGVDSAECVSIGPA